MSKPQFPWRKVPWALCGLNTVLLAWRSFCCSAPIRHICKCIHLKVRYHTGVEAAIYPASSILELGPLMDQRSEQHSIKHPLGSIVHLSVLGSTLPIQLSRQLDVKLLWREQWILRRTPAQPTT
ncbi:unnamed protein product, partial [Sphacelaria rigidula]